MALFYREEGNGYPLILLHGLWGASENWLPVAHLLSSRFRVILPDMRNHGRSPHYLQHDYSSMSQDILELIEELHLSEKPYLAGHSMGGKTAMALLLQNPSAVAKTVVIDIAPISYPLSDEHREISNYLKHTAPASFSTREEMQKHIFRSFPDTASRQLLLKNLRKTASGFSWKLNPEALQQNIGALSTWPEKFAHIVYPYPILFIKGEQSDYIPDKNCLLKQFPAALLETIPFAGHRIHAEQPEMLAQKISSFFP